MVYRCAAHTHIVALACACALTCAASTRADLVVESVDIGVGGIVRGGGWTRFAVTLATDTEGFEGTAYVSLGAEENGIELALVRNGRTRWETVARTPDLPTDGTVRWVDTAQAESSYSFPIPAPLAPNDLGVLAVTSTAGTLAYVGGEIRLDGADPDSPQRVRVKPSETGSLSSLPSDWLAWSGVDVVVWRGLHPNSSAWAPAQQTALLRWIRRGGTFVWLEDAGTPTLDGTPLAPLMALAPANWVDMSLPRGDSLRVPVSIRTGTLAPGARSVLTVEGNPLIAARDIGMGRALYVGVPLAACTPTMEAALWRDVFGAVRRQPLAPWERLDPAQRQRLVDRLNALPGSAPARSGRLALLTVVWVVCISALAMLFARRRRWAVGVALALSACATAAPIVWRSRNRSIPAQEWGVLRVYPESGDAYWRGTLTVDPVDATSFVMPFSTNPNPTALSGGPSGVWVADIRGAGGTIRDVSTGPNQARHWEAQAFVPSPGSLSVETDSPDGSLRLTNHMNVAFERGAVVAGGAAAFVDGLREGENRPIEFAAVETRRSFWSQLSLPTPLHSYWSREGLLDALMTGDTTYWVGWVRGASVVGMRASSAPAHALLVIVPLDITADRIETPNIAPSPAKDTE